MQHCRWQFMPGMLFIWIKKCNIHLKCLLLLTSLVVCAGSKDVICLNSASLDCFNFTTPMFRESLIGFLQRVWTKLWVSLKGSVETYKHSNLSTLQGRFRHLVWRRVLRVKWRRRSRSDSKWMNPFKMFIRAESLQTGWIMLIVYVKGYIQEL